MGCVMGAPPKKTFRCPYCGNAYDLVDNDTTLTWIHHSKRSDQCMRRSKLNTLALEYAKAHTSFSFATPLSTAP